MKNNKKKKTNNVKSKKITKYKCSNCDEKFSSLKYFNDHECFDDDEDFKEVSFVDKMIAN